MLFWTLCCAVVMQGGVFWRPWWLFLVCVLLLGFYIIMEEKKGEKDESGFHGTDVVCCLKSESWPVSVQHAVKAEINVKLCSSRHLRSAAI